MQIKLLHIVNNEYACLDDLPFLGNEQNLSQRKVFILLTIVCTLDNQKKFHIGHLNI